MSHHPTPRESHLAHEDARNEASRRLRDATRLIEAREESERLRSALREAIQLARDFNRGAMTWKEYDRKLAALGLLT